MKMDGTEYGEMTMLNLAMKTRYLMERQAQTGIRFDIEKAKRLEKELQGRLEEIAQRVEPQLPPRELKKGEMSLYKFPKKCFNIDGSHSALLLKFIEKHKISVVGNKYLQNGTYVDIIGDTYLPAQMPMKLGESDALKDWLVSLGWRPTLWNFKKDKRNKPIRDKETGLLIKTAPKIHDKGVICANLQEMDIGIIPDIVLWFSLRHRLGQLNSWSDNSRINVDCRLTSGSSGVTNTFRQRHTAVVNVPKAEEGILYGKEFRSLFIADEGMVLVGYDAAALEARVEAHYTYKYDGGIYARELLDGDIHSRNAFVFYGDRLAELGITESNFSKDSIEFKPFRSKSKNGKYCLSYGGQYAKLAETLGVPPSKGRELYDNFWDSNPSLAELKRDVIAFYKKHGHLKAIDGRKLYGRSEHSYVNMLFQSCGALAMDIAGCFMDNWLGTMKLDSKGLPSYLYKGHVVRRVGYFHDEYLWECPKEISSEIAELGVKSIVKAGEMLGLRVPLNGEAHIGNNWSEVH